MHDPAESPSASRSDPTVVVTVGSTDEPALARANRVKHQPRTLKTQHFDAMLGRRPVRMTPLLALHRLDPQVAADAGLLMPSGTLLGVMVAKRHAKRAVWRNAIKRQLRESFRLHPLPEGGWLIRLRGSIVPWSDQRKHEIRQQVDELMQRTLASERKAGSHPPSQMAKRPKSSKSAKAANPQIPPEGLARG